jgi:hypothetical protein
MTLKFPQVPTDPAKTGENDVNVALNNVFNYITEKKVFMCTILRAYLWTFRPFRSGMQESQYGINSLFIFLC